jgi:hypothetical protein
MTPTTSLFFLLALAASPDPDAGAASMADCAMHASHMAEKTEHAAGVTQRGDDAMGFSHQTTAHHFQLTPAGGVISVFATSSADVTSIEAIQAHLAKVAQAFASGDFAIPRQIHGVVPPGVPIMKKRRSAISYAFQAMPQGGNVVISSQDSRAVDAVHAFLRFQIADHHTGDSTEIAAH